MDKNRSACTSTTLGSDMKPRKTIAEMKNASRKARGDCDVSKSTSHTQFYRKSRNEEEHKRITIDQYFGISESMSGSSDTFHCVNKPDGKVYTKQGLLKRNILKELDPIPTDLKWTKDCQPAYGWAMAQKLEFLVRDPTVGQQKERLLSHLRDFVEITSSGYKVELLGSVRTIIDYLIETLPKNPDQKVVTVQILRNLGKPILLNLACDVVKYFDDIAEFIGFMGYLLMRVEGDSMFDVVSEAILWHLSAPDSIRGQAVANLRCTLVAAASVLYHTVVRMIAVATSHRFPTYLTIALLLACHSVDNCVEMMKENIIENIFYRFNPYFPERKLPDYDITPADPHDINVKLGDSSVNMSTTLSLLLVLVKTVKQYIAENPKYSLLLPCPDSYGQRCFVWAYRYECRAREHRHQRVTLTVIANGLLHCFGDRLMEFSSILMPDIMTLSVMTELPPRSDWTSTVNFNTAQRDVQFKKILIFFSVDLLKVFPYNKFMVESQYWLLGLMYLLDPGLSSLRASWSASLFAEIRKTALQALVCSIPRIAPKLVKEYGLIRRIMWYIEWYSESPYELPVLYWCVRLLQVTIYHRGDPTRKTSMKDLFDTHGIIIIIHLCYTLLEQKTPPVEKSQAIIGLCLRLLTSAVESKTRVICCVYPNIKWPIAVNALAWKMLDLVLSSLEKHFIISDRWLISLLNFIWEAIIWKTENRKKFIARDGIYKLLDIITMTRAPVQCIALALVCDAARAGDAVGQLVSWRANLGASNANPNVVKRGATIATLLAAIFRDECRMTGVRLDENGVIESWSRFHIFVTPSFTKDLDMPIISSVVRKEMGCPSFSEPKSQRTPVCLAAADLAGSRLSKAFALLHMLSGDLHSKVCLADEAYNLYKNVRLAPEDEAILVLCSNFLTMKLNEVWVETKIQSPGLLEHDEEILDEFLHIGRGWAKDIKQQQNDVIEMHKKQETEEENSLYEFLGRVRLNIALDALQEVRCVARSADRARMTHALLQDAVRAHQRRTVYEKSLCAPVLRTYGPKLDNQNITGQNVKVYSIYSKSKPKPLIVHTPSSE